eukprot:Gb_38546 [translate_table: standard]
MEDPSSFFGGAGLGWQSSFSKAGSYREKHISSKVVARSDLSQLCDYGSDFNGIVQGLFRRQAPQGKGFPNFKNLQRQDAVGSQQGVELSTQALVGRFHGQNKEVGWHYSFEMSGMLKKLLMVNLCTPVANYCHGQSGALPSACPPPPAASPSPLPPPPSLVPTPAPRPAPRPMACLRPPLPDPREGILERGYGKGGGEGGHLGFVDSNSLSVARILVSLDLGEGITKEMLIQKGDLIHSQLLDYVGIPFHCRRCHKYGRFASEYSLSLIKKVWVKKAILEVQESQKDLNISKSTLGFLPLMDSPNILDGASQGEESLGDGSVLVKELRKLLKVWDFITSDVVGRSGGLILRWRRWDFQCLNSLSVKSRLSAVMYSQELGEEFFFLNVYGPYADRMDFWDRFLANPFLRENNVILGGDSNFMLSNAGIWGSSAHSNPLSSYFLKKLEVVGLVDVEPTKLSPTWRTLRIAGFPVEDTKLKVKSLELKRRKLLEEKEHLWRLNSRALWLAKGDENTKYFHQYANFRKNVNTIWKIHRLNGMMATGFDDLAYLGVEHFDGLYKEENKATIDEDKSPGPDGWTIEFFLGCYDFIESDLIRVIKELRSLGSRRDALKLKEILDLYYAATGMHIELKEGLKYLGFIVKPNANGVKDWSWLIAKVKKRLLVWCNRWISRGGRLTLIKSVLEGVLDVFSLHSTWGVGERGWGLKNLHLSSEALTTRSAWRLITSDGLWSLESYCSYFSYGGEVLSMECGEWKSGEN